MQFARLQTPNKPPKSKNVAITEYRLTNHERLGTIKAPDPVLKNLETPDGPTDSITFFASQEGQMFVRMNKGHKPEPPCARYIFDPSLDGERSLSRPCVIARFSKRGLGLVPYQHTQNSRDSMPIRYGFPFLLRGAGRKVMMAQASKLSSVNGSETHQEPQKEQLAPGITATFKEQLALVSSGYLDESSRGHVHVIEVDVEKIDDEENIVLMVDDREGDIKQATADRLRQFASGLCDLAYELDGIEAMKAPHRKGPLHVVIENPDGTKDVKELTDPRVEYCRVMNELLGRQGYHADYVADSQLYGQWAVIAYDTDGSNEVLLLGVPETTAVCWAIGFNQGATERGHSDRALAIQLKVERATTTEAHQEAPESTIENSDSVVEEYDYTAPATHTESEFLAGELSKLTDFLRVTYKGSWHDVHRGTSDGANYAVELMTYADSCPFNEFNVSDINEPLNEVIAERLDGYACYFEDLAETFREWKPEPNEYETTNRVSVTTKVSA